MDLYEANEDFLHELRVRTSIIGLLRLLVKLGFKHVPERLRV